VFDPFAFTDSIAALQQSNRQMLSARPASGAQHSATPGAPDATKAAMLAAWLHGSAGLADGSHPHPHSTHSQQQYSSLPAASLSEVRDALAALQFEFDLDRIWGRLAEVARLLARCERVAIYLVRFRPSFNIQKTHAPHYFLSRRLIDRRLMRCAASWYRSLCPAA
jgi:hypothetical protein